MSETKYQLTLHVEHPSSYYTNVSTATHTQNRDDIDQMVEAFAHMLTMYGYSLATVVSAFESFNDNYNEIIKYECENRRKPEQLFGDSELG